jgi:hypothetical protein
VLLPLRRAAPAQVADIDAELATLGPTFERNAVFPARTNTEFVEVGPHGGANG